jgi:hypothetical protein
MDASPSDARTSPALCDMQCRTDRRRSKVLYVCAPALDLMPEKPVGLGVGATAGCQLADSLAPDNHETLPWQRLGCLVMRKLLALHGQTAPACQGTFSPVANRQPCDPDRRRGVHKKHTACCASTRAPPVRIRNVVVLPAPLSPSSPKHSPRPMPSQRPATARVGGCPPPVLYDLATPSSSTCHCDSSAPAGGLHWLARWCMCSNGHRVPWYSGRCEGSGTGSGCGKSVQATMCRSYISCTQRQVRACHCAFK